MMTLHGVDVYIWTETNETPEITKEFGSLKLTLISNRGTRVYPGPAPDIALLNWPRCRYESDTEVTDAQIQTVLNELTASGYRWTKAQKLFREDGNNLYSQPY
ncbi:MAG: hypothetical protein JNM85_11005 [Chthonomonas sp.]|nr:hypothetical protein [Chthonomonas sp.]